MKKNKIAMKKDTSKLISEKHFWEIIEASDKRTEPCGRIKPSYHR